MVKSIITEDMSSCFVCGNPQCDIHHIIYGPFRSDSDKYGLTVPLCRKHHSEVHLNAKSKLNENLKILAQVRFEKMYGHDEFMRIFRKNYL